MYVSPETHENLKKIARLFYCEHHTTTSSLADTIISRHIETYRDILNEEHRGQERKFLEELNSLGRKDDSESSQDDDYDE